MTMILDIFAATDLCSHIVCADYLIESTTTSCQFTAPYICDDADNIPVNTTTYINI